jgi:hypothetical protein
MHGAILQLNMKIPTKDDLKPRSIELLEGSHRNMNRTRVFKLIDMQVLENVLYWTSYCPLPNVLLC